MTKHDDRELVELIADRLQARGFSLAAAESLTCGWLVSSLGRGPDAKTWLRGGIVAYQSEVKQQVLGVTPGPVITARCAEELAVGAARVFAADLAITTTGAGGPGPEEGEPAGTVYLGWSVEGAVGSERFEFDGDPDDILSQTVYAALQQLEVLLRTE
ncbi:CinA family protein [Pseudoclavibacter sp. AY1H1]|uniref:CinA family protein n=1 Tax=Pseudoclavibacter sp. AY1H1 TaxID=2080584 RepID=UPI000CE8D94A|nr:nicotinamide-nucleotide amidohydrolase family protein [Pseudoclavibacter sp. AY1H1]PPF36089.1 CinA family protein [Pseudoclavibacter sp. AY1H1]